ncbi:hypothetical protein HAX54_007753 [Datura stramonium]|uniref:Amine oxidase domain-containing protein n=1 Tax=Datura stramonium TaxID=4076 RepID=A0ABS8RJI6_DATST|nr:hypothetical protein [Datura stramonium]
MHLLRCSCWSHGDRLSGIHTDYSFGCPVDMGASWLHGVCDENPLAPLIRRLGLTLYRTSGDNSVLFMLFDMDGHQVPQNTVVQVGIYSKILSETEKVRNEHSHDLSVLQAISIVLDRQGLSHEVLQWYICRMEAWFAADADTISLKTTGSGKVKSITNGYHKVMVTVEDGREILLTDAAIITVPLGVLKANLIEFEPKLPEWKQSAIADLGVVAPTSYACGYFLNLHKATGHPVLVYMAAEELCL